MGEVHAGEVAVIGPDGVYDRSTADVYVGQVADNPVALILMLQAGDGSGLSGPIRFQLDYIVPQLEREIAKWKVLRVLCG